LEIAPDLFQKVFLPSSHKIHYDNGSTGGKLMTGSKAVGVHLVVSILVLLILLPPVQAGPSEGPVPVVSVTLDPTWQVAEVTQSQSGEVTVQGTIDIDQPQIMMSNVTIKAVMNTGWPIEVEPTTTQVTGPAIVNFQVDVVVPAATSSLIVGNLIVTVSVKAPLLTAVHATATAVVSVSQYYKLRIEASDPLVHMERGQSGEIEVSIYNDGNGQDTFEISLEDVPNGIRASLETNQITIPQDDNETVAIDVTVENDSPNEMHTITVKVVSLESGREYYKTYPVFVDVRSKGDILESPSLGIPSVLMTIILVASIFRSKLKRIRST
jgi:hypothetical protein